MLVQPWKQQIQLCMLCLFKFGSVQYDMIMFKYCNWQHVTIIISTAYNHSKYQQDNVVIILSSSRSPRSSKVSKPTLLVLLSHHPRYRSPTGILCKSVGCDVHLSSKLFSGTQILFSGYLLLVPTCIFGVVFVFFSKLHDRGFLYFLSFSKEIT